MKDLNKVILRGVLSEPPKKWEFDGGSKVVNINVHTVTSEADSDGGERDQKAWHRVSARGKNADVAEGLDEDSPVYVEGELRTRSYTNREGQEAEATEVRARVLRAVRSADPHLNHSILLGSVDRKQKLRESDSLIAAGVRVAVDEKRFRKVGGGFEDYEEAAFYEVAAFGDLAKEMDRTTQKGERIFALGYVRTRKYTDREGEDRRATETVVRTILANGNGEAPSEPDEPEEMTGPSREDDGGMEDEWL